MDVRRAALVTLVTVLVCSTTILAGFTVVDGTSMNERPAARAAADDDPNATALSCPPRAAAAGATASSETPTRPRIVGLYPNPTTDENVGEFLVLETPPETRLENWTITDGHTTATIPNATVTRRVALSTDPDVTKTLTDVPTLALEGHLRLAVDGDELRLRNATTTIDTVSYDRAPTAERWYRTAAVADDTDDRTGVTGQWWPRDASCLPVSSAAVDEATAFVLPDAPEIPLETIRAAEDRLLLAGYTITSSEIADELVTAADRGVEVAVLLESSPVGGTPKATEPVLETLEGGGVDVRVIGGEGARYRYHHPKYAVADDRVLVTSENWKPSGIGGASSRGWGVRLADETLAADLAAVFRADHEGWDTESGEAYRANASFVDDDDSIGTASRSYPTEHEPATVPVDSAELLVAPDNAEGRLRELVGGADDEILVKQASIDRDAAVLEATIDAARRGVDVRILLDSTWYHEAENEALADDLERVAADESLSLEVRVVEETDRFEKIHAKGVVIDREVAVVGSANWNTNAFENNREVLLALHGEEIATYYADVFEDDWDGDGGLWRLPFGISLTVVAGLALAALVGRRYVRFGDPS